MMGLQKIKSIEGKDEYVLLPVQAYRLLKRQIDEVICGDYLPFELQDYVHNPIALARIRAHLTQEELAEQLGVSQAYISKIEKQPHVSAKLIDKIMKKLSTKHGPQPPANADLT